MLRLELLEILIERLLQSRPLDVFFYGLGGHSSDFTKRNQKDFLNFLKENNFSTNEFTNFLIKVE